MREAFTVASGRTHCNHYLSIAPLNLEVGSKRFMNTLSYLVIFSGFSFLFFGCACFLSKKMKLEFERYGLPSFRKAVGALQLLGGVGLIVGMVYSPALQLYAAFGLSVLMFLGFWYALRSKMPCYWQPLPSFTPC